MSKLGNARARALAVLLKRKRKDAGLTLRGAVALLPPWLGFQHSTLDNVEKCGRIVSYIELVELTAIYGTDVATVDAELTREITAKGALSSAPSAPRRRKTPARKR